MNCVDKVAVDVVHEACHREGGGERAKLNRRDEGIIASWGRTSQANVDAVA